MLSFAHDTMPADFVAEVWRAFLVNGFIAVIPFGIGARDDGTAQPRLEEFYVISLRPGCWTGMSARRPIDKVRSPAPPSSAGSSRKKCRASSRSAYTRPTISISMTIRARALISPSRRSCRASGRSCSKDSTAWARRRHIPDLLNRLYPNGFSPAPLSAALSLPRCSAGSWSILRLPKRPFTTSARSRSPGS